MAKGSSSRPVNAVSSSGSQVLVVSTPRHHTGVVITEYGAAQLNGLTVRERATALADIAHPDFRAELHAVAQTLGRA
jgi:acyl-CoA hydrolase